MTAAVYIVGGNRDHEELRFSLRSVEKNAPDVTSVWIVGHVPDWVRGVRTLPLDPLPEKFANQRQSLTAFANQKGAPTKFYLFNEDHYVIEPIDGAFPVFHLGPALAYITSIWRPRNTWHRAVKATSEWLTGRAGEEVLCYETHTPLLFDRHRLRDVLAEYPADRPLAMTQLYVEAGLSGVGVNAGNAKVKSADTLEAKLAQAMPFTSGNQDSFNGAHGDVLRATFPEPSRWEAT